MTTSTAIRWPQASIFRRADPVAFGPYGGRAPLPVEAPMWCDGCGTRWSGLDSQHCWCCGRPSPGSRPALPVLTASD